MRRLAFSALCFTTSVLLAGAGSAEAQSFQVTYVGNAGFLVQMGKKKILIDGCFRGFAGAYLLPQEIQDKLAKAQPPFDGIDLILATHAHGDHFDSELVRKHLQSNPNAVFASTRQATAPLMDLQGRVLTFEARRGRVDRKQMAGLQVEALSLSHGAPAAGKTEILNYGYVVSVGGFSFFHSGDIDPSQVTFEEFRAYNLPEKKLGVAFVQHYCLGEDASDRRLVREGIAARLHLPKPLPSDRSSVPGRGRARSIPRRHRVPEGDGDLGRSSGPEGGSPGYDRPRERMGPELAKQLHHGRESGENAAQCFPQIRP